MQEDGAYWNDTHCKDTEMSTWECGLYVQNCEKAYPGNIWQYVNIYNAFFGFILTLTEPTVRAELMEQVPHIAMFCQENRPSIPYAFSKYLLPIVVRYLADQNNQVSVL